MEIFLVGGAVRDELLGRDIKDRDWVVVGAKPEQMLDKGFVQVGKSFPVFLHPKTKEEYALARVERKVSPGYGGFEFNTDDTVTLEEDLSRRDLTINAIAKDDSGQIIDPYNGQSDLNARVLRHVSDAFREDPLRVLRVARFYAQLAEYDFKVASETVLLMKGIVKSGELDFLSSERVFQESARALLSSRPDLYIYLLAETGAFKEIFKSDFNNNLYSLLQESEKFNLSIAQRLFLVTYCLKEKDWDKCISARLSLPKDVKSFIGVAMKNFDSFCSLSLQNTTEVLDFLNRLDIWRKGERALEIISAYNLIKPDPDRQNIAQKLLPVIKSLQKFKPNIESTVKGQEIAKAVQEQKLLAVTQALENS